MRKPGLIVLSLILAVGCGGGGTTVAKTAAQRIDEAAAIIGKAVNAGADDVENTFRLTVRTNSDEALAASMERLAAAKQANWTTKAWNAARTTAEVAQNDVISWAAGLTCEGLQQWEEGQAFTRADVTSWASQWMRLPEDNSAVKLAAAQAVAALEYHQQEDMEYIRWIRATACFVDAIP